MKKRIFTAVDISSEARAKASDYIKNLRERFSTLRVGWEKAEKLHLTMKFLGDVDENQLPSLIAAVEKTAGQISEFDLRIEQTGAFPSIQRARILWLGVRDEQGSLTKINDILETECQRIGFARENRNFNPHLTIARLREPNRARELVELHQENGFSSERFTVNEIVVYQSRLLPNGSQYTPIFRAALTN